MLQLSHDELNTLKRALCSHSMRVALEYCDTPADNMRHRNDLLHEHCNTKELLDRVEFALTLPDCTDPNENP